MVMQYSGCAARRHTGFRWRSTSVTTTKEQVCVPIVGAERPALPAGTRRR